MLWCSIKVTLCTVWGEMVIKLVAITRKTNKSHNISWRIRYEGLVNLFSKTWLVQFWSNIGICFNLYCRRTYGSAWKIMNRIKFIHQHTPFSQIYQFKHEMAHTIKGALKKHWLQQISRNCQETFNVSNTKTKRSIVFREIIEHTVKFIGHIWTCSEKIYIYYLIL